MNKQFSVPGSMQRINCSSLYKARLAVALLLPGLSKESQDVIVMESSREAYTELVQSLGALHLIALE